MVLEFNYLDNNEVAVEKLIKYGANVSLVDNENHTLLHIAAALGNTERV